MSAPPQLPGTASVTPGHDIGHRYLPLPGRLIQARPMTTSTTTTMTTRENAMTDMNRLLRAGREPAEPAKAATGAMNTALRRATGRAPAAPRQEREAEPEEPTPSFEGGTPEDTAFSLPPKPDMSARLRAAANAARGRADG